jgi:hypothetical protein
MKREETPNYIYYFPFSNNYTAIELHKPENKLIGNKPARVTWKAYGAVTPDEAEAYALALLEAAKEAKKLNENTA